MPSPAFPKKLAIGSILACFRNHRVECAEPTGRLRPGQTGTEEIAALASTQMEPAQTQAVQLPNHKVKIKKPGQRACNEKNAKGKLCGGHLKRWYYMDDVLEQACGDVQKAFGPDAEIYRCEHCKTLYLPDPGEAQGLNVAGRGMLSHSQLPF